MNWKWLITIPRKAKKKELTEKPVGDLGIDCQPKVKVIKMSLPEKRSAGRRVESVDALISGLQNEAKVL